MQGYPDFKLHDKIIPLPNIDKDGWVETNDEGRNLADLIHPSKSAPAPRQIVEKQRR